jgi:hypothetical protein
LKQSLALGWTYTISPTLINEFRFGWEKYHVFDVPNGYGTDPATQAGIPGLNLDKTYTSGLPAFYIPTAGDTAQLGYALGVNQCNCPLTETESQFQFVDNLSKTIGKHTIKVGADIRYASNLRVPSDSHRAGELTFNGGAEPGGRLWCSVVPVGRRDQFQPLRQHQHERYGTPTALVLVWPG